MSWTFLILCKVKEVRLKFIWISTCYYWSSSYSSWGQQRFLPCGSSDSFVLVFAALHHRSLTEWMNNTFVSLVLMHRERILYYVDMNY